MTEKQVEMNVKTSSFKKKYVKNKEEIKLKRKKKQLQKKKLIIRNLSFKVSKDELTKIFSAFGEVLKVEVPETKDGKKRGFAFVQFKDTKSQVKAIKELNFQKIHGRPIAIDFCLDKTSYHINSRNDKDDKNDDDDDDSEASVAPETQSNAIENDANASSEDESDATESEGEGSDEDQKVNDFFKKFDGDQETHDTGHADETDDESESDESEEETDDKSSLKSEQPVKKKRAEDVSQGKTVFIRNISFKNSEEDLKTVAEEYGAVEYCLFCMDRFTDQFKGSAFVKFKEKESADKFIQESYNEPGLLLDGRKLYCVYALSRDDISKQQSGSDKEKDKRNLRLLKCGLIMRDSPEAEGVSQTDMAKRAQLEIVKKKKLRNVNFFVSDKRLAIHNLPKNFNDKDVRALFKKASEKDAVITEARVMKDFNKTDARGVPVSRGFGFVSFTEHEHALKALTELNNNPSIFTPNKRPIVEFSIENKVALLSQEKRREKLKMLNKKRSEAQPEIEEKPAIFSLKRKKPTTNEFHSRKKMKSHVPQKEVTLTGKDNKSKKSKKRQKKHPKEKKGKKVQINAQERRNLSTLSNKYKEKLLNKIS